MKELIGKVIWSGWDSCDGGLYCHLTYDGNEEDEVYGWGCACPPEAVDFLRKLGIKVIKVTTWKRMRYSHKAVGCQYHSHVYRLNQGLPSIDPAAYAIIGRHVTDNEDAMIFLKSIE